MGSWMTRQLYIAMGSDHWYHTQLWVGGNYLARSRKRGEKCLWWRGDVSLAGLCPGAAVGVDGSITVRCNESGEELDVVTQFKQLTLRTWGLSLRCDEARREEARVEVLKSALPLPASCGEIVTHVSHVTCLGSLWFWSLVMTLSPWQS